MQIPFGALLAEQALLFVAWAALAWLLLRERRARHAQWATLEARLAAVEQSSGRLALLDRRLAVIGPVDRLRRRWSLGERPDGDELAAALDAIEGARLVFPSTFEEALDGVSALLATCVAHHAWERRTSERGRGEQDRALQRRAELEQRLRPALEALRARMAELARAPKA